MIKFYTASDYLKSEALKRVHFKTAELRENLIREYGDTNFKDLAQINSYVNRTIKEFSEHPIYVLLKRRQGSYSVYNKDIKVSVASLGTDYIENTDKFKLDDLLNFFDTAKENLGLVFDSGHEAEDLLKKAVGKMLIEEFKFNEYRTYVKPKPKPIKVENLDSKPKRGRPKNIVIEDVRDASDFNQSFPTPSGSGFDNDVLDRLSKSLESLKRKF